MTQPPHSRNGAPPSAAERERAELITRAAAAVRDLRDALVDDGLDHAVLAEEVAAIEAIAVRLSGGAARNARANPEWGAPGTHPLLSPVSGAGNPVAPPLVYEEPTPPDVARGTVTFSRAFEGPPGNVHGGWVAAAFDDILGRASVAAGHGGPTGTIAVRLIAPTPLNRPLTMVARVVRVEGRKATATGELLDGDRVCAEGEAIFIKPRGEAL